MRIRKPRFAAPHPGARGWNVPPILTGQALSPQIGVKPVRNDQGEPSATVDRGGADSGIEHKCPRSERRLAAEPFALDSSDPDVKRRQR